VPQHNGTHMDVIPPSTSATHKSKSKHRESHHRQMPTIYEVFGFSPDDKTDLATETRYNALCPFTKSRCDGGGNRHQTKIKLKGSDLSDSFNPSLDSILPGVCSIMHSDSAWIVCPRRLLGFGSTKDTGIIRKELQEHERQALLVAGLPAGVELGVWAEVYLSCGDNESKINYHFDFVIAKLQRRKSLNYIFNAYHDISEAEANVLYALAKKSHYISDKMDMHSEADLLPDLSNPYIVEVMTASTSGSDTSAGTDIASSFRNLILGYSHVCPGINKRQVWGRMATQLFAKSALAEAWGGKTVWIVQDELLNNIGLTTKMSTEQENFAETENKISFVSLGYRQNEAGVLSLQVNALHEKGAGIDFKGSGKCIDILLPKVYPNKVELLKAVLRRKLTTVITL
jgi:hypothetical protein